MPWKAWKEKKAGSRAEEGSREGSCSHFGHSNAERVRGCPKSPSPGWTEGSGLLATCAALCPHMSRERRLGTVEERGGREEGRGEIREERKAVGRAAKRNSPWEAALRAACPPDSLVGGALGERHQGKKEQPLHGSSWLPRLQRREDGKGYSSRKEPLLIYSPSPQAWPYQPLNVTLYSHPNQKVS